MSELSPGRLDEVAAALPARAARTLVLEDGIPRTLDQTLLPFRTHWIALDTLEACAAAISGMQVRGAPLIGVAGAWGVARAMLHDPSDAALDHACRTLVATRPTAVNLAWAVERVRAALQPLAPARRAAQADLLAREIGEEDVRLNAAIALHGARVLLACAAGQTLQVLTHCNAGRLATVALGTALAPLYLLHAAGVPLHVWVDETRPRNQGASLTAWELADAGIPHTVVADNAGGWLMREGRVDAVIVGTDRVAANGDVANKIGTYLKALAAHDCGLPFLVACPSPTLDFATPDGAAIDIECRADREVTHLSGIDDEGVARTVRVVPVASAVLNPAFDVTPARLVSLIVTERGCVPARADALAALFPERVPA